MNLIITILVIILLLFVNGAISAAEIAYFSLSPADLNEIKAKKNSANQLILYLLSRPKRLLATILIGNNFLNVGIVMLSTYITATYTDFSNHPILGFVIQVVVVTSLILLIAEIMPKVYASRNTLVIASYMSRPLSFMLKIFYPLNLWLVKSTNFIDKRMANRKYILSMDDLSTAIDITKDGTVNEEDTKIMKSITRFGDINAREIMRPRVDVTAVEETTSYLQLLKIVIDSGYSRIPVYRETHDSVMGILYIKDLFPYLEKDDKFEWVKLVRPAFFVPENKPINDLLQEFREKKIHMAVVVDEYGGTSGIITLEDIIEEIVGDINDEFDSETEGVIFSKLDDRNYIFEGKTQLNDFCKIVGLEDRIFEDAKGESDTLAGLMLELAGKMPAYHESISFEHFVFRIEALDKRRIKRVKVTILDPEPKEEQ
ncbi:MAG: gliding motility-associated protein GldE [Bacteroidetes bacterium]|nr:gliding motility-associated protein GldE [Bacteroidota bacterium]